MVSIIGRVPPRTIAEHPTYYQVVRLVTFQNENPNFSLIASSVGGAGTSPPTGADAAHAAL